MVLGSLGRTSHTPLLSGILDSSTPTPSAPRLAASSRYSRRRSRQRVRVQRRRPCLVAPGPHQTHFTADLRGLDALTGRLHTDGGTVGERERERDVHAQFGVSEVVLDRRSQGWTKDVWREKPGELKSFHRTPTTVVGSAGKMEMLSSALPTRLTTDAIFRMGGAHGLRVLGVAHR